METTNQKLLSEAFILLGQYMLHAFLIIIFSFISAVIIVYLISIIKPKNIK
jgi:hypothetical protein